MEQEKNERKLFGFLIEIREEDVLIPPRAKILNQGVPMETVIMQMRAFLDKAEKDYFDEFNTPQHDS